MRIIRKLFCHLHIEFTKILHFNPPRSITTGKAINKTKFCQKCVHFKDITICRLLIYVSECNRWIIWYFLFLAQLFLIQLC